MAPATSHTARLVLLSVDRAHGDSLGLLRAALWGRTRVDKGQVAGSGLRPQTLTEPELRATWSDVRVRRARGSGRSRVLPARCSSCRDLEVPLTPEVPYAAVTVATPVRFLVPSVSFVVLEMLFAALSVGLQSP